MMNMAVGTVVSIDLNNRAVQVQPTFGQAEARWVVITQETRLVRQIKSKIDELKEGDEVFIQGIPTAIKADQIRIGEMPSLFPGMRRGVAGAGGEEAPQNAPPGMLRPNRIAMASVQGKVAGLDPLTVTLQDRTEVAVAATEKTSITKIVKGTFRDIKQNDFLMANGEPDEQGNLYANTVAVGIDFGQMMGGMGGFGGMMRGGRRGGGQPPAPQE